MATPNSPYDEDASGHVRRWESVTFRQVHDCWSHLLPAGGGIVLDIGAGSGRDAAHLAELGFEVVAVEPSARLREEAQRLHPSGRIRWVEDSLPALAEVHRLDYRYDVILLSAVWMHVRPAQRERAFRILAEMLKPGGILVFTLRHGPLEPARKMFPAGMDELERLGRKRALLPVPLPRTRSADALGREEVHWTTAVFRLPDDGTGSLSLLRHIIVNDSKSSTYKLALLRVLVRAADGARGLVLERDDEHVTVPFGLVALYWLKTFKPLLFPTDPARETPYPGGGYPQHANPSLGLGFVGEGFLGLTSVSPHDIRVGARMEASDARNLVRALGDVCRNIRAMPAHHITHPGTERTVFDAEYRGKPRVRGSHLTVDRDFLSAFGSFRIPTAVWEAMSRYACWLEPAILHEWCELMRMYDEKRGVRRALNEYLNALSWLEPERNTRDVRSLIEGLQRSGAAIHCVWSGRRLQTAYEIDHCLPFAVWPNNDLWNLMPASRTANQKKSRQLPSAELMLRARERILEWWNRAYSVYSLFPRFRDEAFASLPLAASLAAASLREAPSAPFTVFEAVFAGADNQRARLRTDQQVKEWGGLQG